MKHKLWIGGLILCMIGGLLAGCSSKTETPANGNSEFVYENDYVKLPEYKGLEYSDSLKEVTDEDVENRINEYLQANAGYEQITEGTAENGDTVNVSFTGTIDGETFDGGSADGSNITLGSGTFIEGFEDGIVGMSVGETKDVECTFPEDYGDEMLNGKDAVFSITLNYICGEQNQVPELNDEYVQSVSNAQTVDEYRELIREELVQSNEASFDANVRANLIAQIRDSAEFKEVPEDMVAEYKEQVLESYQGYADMFGLSYEDFVTDMLTTTEEDLDKTLDTEAENAVKDTLVFQAIAENENLEVTDTEFEEYLTEQATNYGYSSMDEYRTELEDNDQIEDAKAACLNEMVYDFIFDNAVYVEGSSEVETETEIQETENTETDSETSEEETTEESSGE